MKGFFLEISEAKGASGIYSVTRCWGGGGVCEALKNKFYEVKFQAFSVWINSFKAPPEPWDLFFTATMYFWC